MAEKTKIYILHGWSVNPDNEKKWEHFIHTLGLHSIDAEFLAIPGLSTPLHEIWNLDTFVSWLEKQLPRDKKSILLGHSFGGQMAIRFTAQHPHRVEKLILVDSAGIRDHDLLPTLKRKVFLLAAKLGKLLFPIPLFKTILYSLARERDYNNAPPLLKRTMSSILDDEIVEDLPQISCKTLIIWGERDAVTPLKLGLIFKRKISDNTFIVIPNARHSPHFTHPQETVDSIRTFLN